ncbi:MAG: Voltage-gated potassium channel Kch [Elusimicrobia bacterium ADurb.Bin231]|nr:MAG: Voltage-gated potassium channel Kch [Elusimicrobia bacterium ADurb.Bin231]
MGKKIINTLLILVVLLSVGTAGYMFIEEWRFLDSLFMTVITLTTVGYGETFPLSQSGRIFTIFLILFGMSLLLYTVSSITSFFIGGELSQIFRRKKMHKQISQLKDHYIICGFGRIGIYISTELKKIKRDFVIIEKNKSLLEKVDGYLYIEGDASADDILKSANVENASGLFAALPTDEENLFLIITARELNSKMKIVSKALNENSVHKLITAGASAVIQPNLIGGLRMVSEMLRPAVVSFLDKMLKEGKGDLRVDEAELKINQAIIKNIDFKSTGTLLLAVYTRGEYLFNPVPDTKIFSGDKLIVMGNSKQVAELRRSL